MIDKISNGLTNICLVSGVILIALVAFLDVNKNYFHFKKFSFSVIWKLYNFIVCSIAIWINEKENKIYDFNELKTQREGDISASINLIAWVTGAMLLSLLPGVFVNNKGKITTCSILCIYLIYRGVYYYFNPQYDATVTILNQQVSMRNQIVNRSMDLALWIGYQGYQSWTHPSAFQVTSKLEIKWT